MISRFNGLPSYKAAHLFPYFYMLILCKSKRDHCHKQIIRIIFAWRSNLKLFFRCCRSCCCCNYLFDLNCRIQKLHFVQFYVFPFIIFVSFKLNSMQKKIQGNTKKLIFRSFVSEILLHLMALKL